MFNWSQLEMVESLGVHSRELSGQYVLKIRSAKQDWVMKAVTADADSTTVQELQHEIACYQCFRQQEFCHEFYIYQVDDHIVGNFNGSALSKLNLSGQFLLLPYQSTLKTLTLNDWSLGKKIKNFMIICQTVQQLHDLGYVHADLKLSHFCLQQDQIKLLDFAQTQKIQEQNIKIQPLGTPAYMAPELFLGRCCSIQSDIYALGICFYEILNGKKPYQGKTYRHWAQLHCQQDIPLCVEPKQYLQSVLDRMLAKQLQHRFSTLNEVINALSELKPRKSQEIDD
ncbi:protein kinase [Acinetobacter qingfengensis]|uniref:Protein kinase domain-containing protein n=1 Tax=Acinetobacter qingfengensis TaxID=1262585 RepID=A0A1E7RCC1_9GAMM|nr:protein kinase [Acinetobacter qingfengensis]KAA8734963.1 protein kinase [Acinetobacter qingfengensis]OEY97050.1 hypothetical protein BJI46_10990 [Acinetobacter qingfengensis]